LQCQATTSMVGMIVSKTNFYHLVQKPSLLYHGYNVKTKVLKSIV
jgi:hypothetical protein